MEKEFVEKKISSEDIFEGKVVHLFRDVVELPDGGTSTREYINHVGRDILLRILFSVFFFFPCSKQKL